LFYSTSLTTVDDNRTKLEPINKPTFIIIIIIYYGKNLTRTCDWWLTENAGSENDGPISRRGVEDEGPEIGLSDAANQQQQQHLFK